MESSKLYLASQSPIRRQLLQEAHIPFEVIDQDADELSCDWGLPIEQLVVSIATKKMEHAILPQGRADGQVIFVLSADTLVQGPAGQFYGKPHDRNEAAHMLRELRGGINVATGFCCEKKIWRNGQWYTELAVQKVVQSRVVVAISDRWIEAYLDQHPRSCQTAGALFVEGYGAQFIKTVHGSYTTVLGLPMCEVREALESLGFVMGV